MKKEKPCEICGDGTSSTIEAGCGHTSYICTECQKHCSTSLEDDDCGKCQSGAFDEAEAEADEDDEDEGEVDEDESSEDEDSEAEYSEEEDNDFDA